MLKTNQQPVDDLNIDDSNINIDFLNKLVDDLIDTLDHIDQLPKCNRDDDIINNSNKQFCQSDHGDRSDQLPKCNIDDVIINNSNKQFCPSDHGDRSDQLPKCNIDDVIINNSNKQFYRSDHRDIETEHIPQGVIRQRLCRQPVAPQRSSPATYGIMGKNNNSVNDNPNQPIDVPDNPNQPDVADNPNQPDVPDNPNQPDVPDNPNQPDVPDNPNQPDVADNPNQPIDVIDNSDQLIDISIDDDYNLDQPSFCQQKVEDRIDQINQDTFPDFRFIPLPQIPNLPLSAHGEMGVGSADKKIDPSDQDITLDPSDQDITLDPSVIPLPIEIPNDPQGVTSDKNKSNVTSGSPAISKGINSKIISHEINNIISHGINSNVASSGIKNVNYYNQYANSINDIINVDDSSQDQTDNLITSTESQRDIDYFIQNLMNKNKNNYCCACIDPNVWYVFKNHRWKKINSVFLRTHFFDELIDECMKQHGRLFNLINEKEGTEKKQYIRQAIRISKVLIWMGDPKSKNDIMQKCAVIAYDSNFLLKLNQNYHLICFSNGIYDLSTNIFRPGRPDDFISLCTNYEYVGYNKNDACYKEIKKFFKKIQPNKTVRKYLLTILSTCLTGSDLDNTLYIFTGSKTKSKLMDLMRYTLGDLFGKTDVLVSTNKKVLTIFDVTDIKGARICVFDGSQVQYDPPVPAYPNDATHTNKFSASRIATNKINSDFVKIFTLNNIGIKSSFKDLSQQHEAVWNCEHKPKSGESQFLAGLKFKPFLLCDYLPNIKSIDDNIWKNIKIILFPNENNPKKNQYWTNDYLPLKIFECRKVFMTMLIKYYYKHKKNKFTIPDLVIQNTTNYRKSCARKSEIISPPMLQAEPICKPYRRKSSNFRKSREFRRFSRKSSTNFIWNIEQHPNK
jgi:hypothetical protein